MTKVTILGAGHGGCACAVDLTLNGFDVILCSAYAPSHIKPILGKHGLEYSGKLGAENVLQTRLSYINAILHPPGMILNAGWIENTSGNFLFYSQGVTNAIARTMDYIDKERVRIVLKRGLKTETFPELFYRYGFTSSVLDSSNQAIKSSNTIQLIQ